MGKFSSYLIEKKLHVLYKKQSVNAVRSNNSLLILILTYLLTAIGFTPSGSSTVHIYTQTIHRTTQLTTDNAINKDKTIKIFCLFIEPHDEDQCLWLKCRVSCYRKWYTQLTQWFERITLTRVFSIRCTLHIIPSFGDADYQRTSVVLSVQQRISTVIELINDSDFLQYLMRI